MYTAFIINTQPVNNNVAHIFPNPMVDITLPVFLIICRQIIRVGPSVTLQKLRRNFFLKLEAILSANRMTTATTSNLAADATQMLAAALEQMDDIIAGKSSKEITDRPREETK